MASMAGLADAAAVGEAGVMNCGAHPAVQIAALVNERNINSRIMRNIVDKSVVFYMMRRNDDEMMTGMVENEICDASVFRIHTVVKRGV